VRLRVVHTTRLRYDAPVREAFTELRLRPLDAGGQRCLSFDLETHPKAEVFHYRDRHGNDVRHFGSLAPHPELVVAATSEVLTPDGFGDAEAALNPLDRHDYLAPTAYAPDGETIRAFAALHALPGRPLDTAIALLAAIHGGLRYAPGSTDVHTTAAEALAQGEGVCQDFAHLMLAACRSLDIPGRYVSGYLHTTGDGGSASHAWVDVFIAGVGWVSLDPTHNAAQTARYVRVAVGRDYAEVPPTRGVYKGDAAETLEVDVRVEPLGAG
jgi:transglutaminase-like putative cysteine protease